MNMTYFRAQHGPLRFFRGAPHYIELKQLADIEGRFRLHCRDAIRRYRHMRREAGPVDDLLERHYRDLEISLQRRFAEQSVALYAMLRRDLRHHVQRYIKAVQPAKF